VPAIEYDPQGALKILGDLGWKDTDGDGILDKDGKPFKLSMVVTGGSKGTMPFVQVYQAELKGVGIQLDIEELDATTMISRVLKGNFQCAFLSWDLDVDPDPFAILHSSQVPPHGQNFVFFSNAAADRLIDQARHEMDEAKRKKLYQDLHALLAGGAGLGEMGHQPSRAQCERGEGLRAVSLVPGTARLVHPDQAATPEADDAGQTGGALKDTIHAEARRDAIDGFLLRASA
jgi:hypothetical protein